MNRGKIGAVPNFPNFPSPEKISRNYSTTCQAGIAASIERRPMNETPEQPTESRTQSKNLRSSYGLGVGFFVAAAATRIVRQPVAEWMAQSVPGGGLYGEICRRNTMVNTYGFFDILMVVLGIIGVVLVVRAYRARHRA